MNQWEEFLLLIDGVNLEDAVEAFFDFVEDRDPDTEEFLKGYNHLIESGKVVLATLVCMEMMIATISVEDQGSREFAEVLTLYLQLKSLINTIEGDDKEQALECLEDLGEGYPEIFALFQQVTE